MAEQTSNYGLLKPLLNETADIAVINQNMDTIDSALKQVEDVTENMSASTISISDEGGHFEATNIEGALEELFTNVSDGKNQVASAITDMGQSAAGSDTFTQLAAKIRDISDDATTGVEDVLTTKTFYQGGTKKTGIMPNQGAVTITPGTANQAITAGYHNGSGYVAGDVDLVSANIKAGINIFGVAGNSYVVDTSAGDATASQILSGKKAYVDGALVTGTIPSKAAETFTPGTTSQTIASGQYLSGTQTISGDADLISANIKAGANIFGVAGNSNVVDTSSGDATAAQILSGKKAYVDGSLITGTMTNIGAVYITPSTFNQSISQGYHSGSGYVYGDADLVAANIKSGVNIFGVAGSCSPRLFASGTGYTGTGGIVAITGLTFEPRSVVVSLSNGLYRKFYDADITNNYSNYTMWAGETMYNTGTWTIGSSNFSTILYNSLAAGQAFSWIAWG